MKLCQMNKPQMSAPEVFPREGHGVRTLSTLFCSLVAQAGEIHAVMAEPSAAKPAPKTPPKAGDKFPLGLARFIAAVHVVLFHLYAEGVTPDAQLISGILFPSFFRQGVET